MPGGKSAGTGAQEQAIRQFQNIRIPTLEEQQLQLLLPEYLGDYQAGQEAAIGMGPTAMEDIAVDPRLQDAQMGALEQISQMTGGGFTPAEEAALNQARRGAASEAQAKSAQLLDEFARRGMGGSGAELAARLQAGQSSADRLSQESDRVAQMAQERALSAIGQQAALGGQIRGQEFGEQSDIARARDAISQFNTANQQQVQQRNVGSTNEANLRNLGEKQRIGEAGTNTENVEQERNKQLLQKKFENEMLRAQGIAGQYNQIAETERANAANSGQMMGNIIGAGAGIVGGIYGGPAGAVAGQQVGKQAGQSMSDKKAKTNLKKTEMTDFLDDLTPYKYDYREPEKHGEGKHFGVMAQDVEIEMPHLVEDTSEGKVIKTDQAIGPILASLADLHNRLKQFES